MAEDQQVNEQTSFIGHVQAGAGAGARAGSLWAIIIATGAGFGVLGYTLYLVRGILQYLGLLLVGALAILILCGIAAPIVLLLRMAMIPKYQESGQHGGYFATILGRVQAAPPLASLETRAGSRAGRTTVTEMALPVIPSLLDLIEQQVIAPGKMEMVMGYDALTLKRGSLEIVTGSWPGTHAVAGKGRSGKTRRVIAMVVQALVSGAHVVICDPHATKPDSLARALEPLEPWLKIARGEREIAQVSHDFFGEMELRVSGLSEEKHDDGQYKPWLIVFDEWSRLMTTQSIEEDDREIMKLTATNCATQYAGYGGYCCIIGQLWTQDATGGTEIRRSIQAAFVHQLHEEYARFFFSKAKWYNRAGELNRRACIYKDTDGIIREIVTMTVPDDACMRVAELLTRLQVPQLALATQEESAQLSEPHTEKLAELPSQSASVESIPPGLSPAQLQALQRLIERATQQAGEPGNGVNALPERALYGELPTSAQSEPMNGVNGHHKPIDGYEIVTAQGEQFTATLTDEPYTREQETAILKAAFQLVRETGKITRSDIMERLGWNKKQWPIIKAVCDKHDIAKQ
jgi:hypothetical protein